MRSQLQEEGKLAWNVSGGGGGRIVFVVVGCLSDVIRWCGGYRRIEARGEEPKKSVLSFLRALHTHV